MSSDDDLEALARLSRERDAERDAWEADAANAPDLLAPLTDLERQRIKNAVRAGRAPAPRRRVWAGVAGVVAIAAAILLALRLGPQGAAVPEYGFELRSQGFSEVRSATVADAWTYADGMTVDIVLRPVSAAPGSTWAAVYRRDGAAVTRLDWTPVRSEGGSLRFKGAVGAQLKLPTGASQLVFVVGARDVVEQWDPKSDVDVQVFERVMTVREGDARE